MTWDDLEENNMTCENCSVTFDSAVFYDPEVHSCCKRKEDIMSPNKQPKFKLGQKVRLYNYEQWKEFPCEPCKGKGKVTSRGYKFVCDYCYGHGNKLKKVKVDTIGIIISIIQNLLPENKYELKYDITSLEEFSSERGLTLFVRWAEEEVERNLITEEI